MAGAGLAQRDNTGLVHALRGHPTVKIDFGLELVLQLIGRFHSQPCQEAHQFKQPYAGLEFYLLLAVRLNLGYLVCDARHQLFPHDVDAVAHTGYIQRLFIGVHYIQRD